MREVRLPLSMCSIKIQLRGEREGGGEGCVTRVKVVVGGNGGYRWSL